MIETITEFLNNESQMAKRINNLVPFYNTSDFIKVDKSIYNYDRKTVEISKGTVYGCLYNTRRKELDFGVDNVEGRLMREYLDYLIDVICSKEDIEKVQYILAYHYLTMVKQRGYQLTVESQAPFAYSGNDITPWGRDNFVKYKGAYYGSMKSLLPYLTEEKIKNYNRIFFQYRYHDWAVKHFSLAEYKLNCETIDEDCFDDGFERLINNFIFKYRAAFTQSDIYEWMPTEEKNEVVEALVDVY